MMDANLQSIAILLVVLLFSMSIHEMMHAFTADWLGDDTARMQGRVSLNPLPHIDPFFTVLLPVISYVTAGVLFAIAKPVQVNFNRLRYGDFGGAIVGMIGPLTNLVIAAVAALIFNATDPIQGTTVYKIFQITIVLNISLFIFNSIPWPPLDGSRLLYAFAPRPVQEFMQRIESIGITGLVIFMFIIYQLSVPIGNLVTSIAHLMAPGLVV